MDWNKIAIVFVVIFILWRLYKHPHAIKQLFDESAAAPQHWGTFIILMMAVILFCIFLIKL